MEPSELFKGKVLKIKNKVEICIETLSTFLESYTECQKHYTQENKIYPWEFPDERIFNPFKSFLERLSKVHVSFLKTDLLIGSYGKLNLCAENKICYIHETVKMYGVQTTGN